MEVGLNKSVNEEFLKLKFGPTTLIESGSMN